MMLIQPEYLFFGILSFIWIEFLWGLYLSYRQHRVYQQAQQVPQELQGILDKETYDKARTYGLDKSSYGIVKDVFEMILTTLVFLYGFLPYAWDLSAALTYWLRADEGGEILQSMVFILLTNTFNTVITLPFSVYYTFVLEEAHGFNKQTAGFYVKDKLKSFAVSQAIILTLTAGIVTIVRAGGDWFFIYLWLFAVAVTFLLLTVYPNYIAPLFDKYTRLEDGALRTRIEQLAASLDFPLTELYVVEGSKRSTHSNAYFYGFFKNKRIVLFDTLLKTEEGEGKGLKTEAGEGKGCDDDEVLAVLGHELGHWQLNHVVKNIAIMQVNLFLVFAVFGAMFSYQPMYEAFGFQEQPVLIGLVIVLQYVFLPYNAVLSFALTAMSRAFEFQADRFAKSLGRAEFLRRALIKLNRDNLGFPVYDRLFSMWHHSHPPLLERLSALSKAE